MNDAVHQFLSSISGAIRFRWLAVVVAWAICVFGWAAVWFIPNSYEARARVYVDTESVLRPLLAGLAVNSDPLSQLRMMQSVLLSRPNLERIARQTDLALRARDPSEFEQLVAGLPRSFGLVGGPEVQTFDISFSDPDREMAQRVVEAMLDSFMEDTIGMKREDASSAERFLEGQLKEYEERLRASEASLAEFKRTNVGLMPGSGGDYYSNLQVESRKLDELQARFRQATDRRGELERQLAGEDPTFLIGPGGVGVTSSPIDAKIAELQRRLDALLVQYTEKHPEVQSIREQLTDLRKLRKDARSPRDSNDTEYDSDANAVAATQPLAMNPVYQSMKMALSQVEVELAELRAQLGQQGAVVAQLRSRVNTMPGIEAQLQELSRDYEINRAQYSELLQRLQSARLSQRAQETNDQIKFRVVEPPKTPKLPVSPNRHLLMALVLAVGIAAGLATPLALNLLRPVFSSASEIKAALGLNVIGSVARITPAGGHFLRSDTSLFAGAAAGLILAFVVLSGYASFVLRQLAS